MSFFSLPKSEKHPKLFYGSALIIPLNTQDIITGEC